MHEVVLLLLGEEERRKRGGRKGEERRKKGGRKGVECVCGKGVEERWKQKGWECVCGRVRMKRRGRLCERVVCVDSCLPIIALANGSSAPSDDDDDDDREGAPEAISFLHNLLTPLFDRWWLWLAPSTPRLLLWPEGEEETEDAVHTKRPRRGGNVPSSSLRTGLLGWGEGGEISR